MSEEEDSGRSSGNERRESLPINNIENVSSNEEDPDPEDYHGQVRSTQCHLSMYYSKIYFLNFIA